MNTGFGEGRDFAMALSVRNFDDALMFRETIELFDVNAIVGIRESVTSLDFEVFIMMKVPEEAVTLADMRSLIVNQIESLGGRILKDFPLG